MVSCFMVIVMLAMLAACSKKEETTGKTDATEVTKTEENKQETTPEPTKEPVFEATATPKPTEEPEPTEEPAPTQEPEDVSYNVDALGNEEWVLDVDRSGMRARILNYEEFVGDNYLVTVDFYDQYAIAYDAIEGKGIGDEIVFENGKKVMIKGFYTWDEDSDYSIENNSYVDGCRIKVMPEDPEDFYTPEQLEMKGYYFDPENAHFGLVADESGENFYGYDDWQWDDCYVPEQYVSIANVKLVVTPNTLVEYVYGENAPNTLSGPEYLLLRGDVAAQDARGLCIFDDVEVYINEIRDDSGRSTGEIGIISEIYMP